MAAQINRRTIQFNPMDLIITENSQRAPYRQRTDDVKTAIHWGQRKLHLSEVEFFTVYWDRNIIPNPLCVYAGAAPGTHITLLSKMFPAFTFHLYDPAPFDLKETDRIKLFQEYFTDDVARRYSGRNDVFFVSDIRTADYKSIQRNALASKGITEFDAAGNPIGPHVLIKEALKESEVINEDQIWGDMGMQQTWVLLMNPEHAFLKFRLPYVLERNPPKDRIVQYLKGIVYWQVWPPQTSTETRLKPVRNANGVYELGDWSILEYEEWGFYHNTADREQIIYPNPFTGTYDPIDFPELLNDYDSTAEAVLLKMYLEKVGFQGDVYSQVKKLSHLITWDLNHQRKDLTKTLGAKRASPIKSTNKAAVDAFRKKKRGKAPTLAEHKAFEHTQIKISPTWRQQATTVAPIVPPIRQGPISPPISITTVVAPIVPPISITAPVALIVPPIRQGPITPPITPVVAPIVPPIRHGPITPPISITTVVAPIVPPIQPGPISPPAKIIPPIAIKPAATTPPAKIIPPIATLPPTQFAAKSPPTLIQPIISVPSVAAISPTQPIAKTPTTIVMPTIPPVAPKPITPTTIAVPKPITPPAVTVPLAQPTKPIIPIQVAVPKPTITPPLVQGVPAVPKPVTAPLVPGVSMIPQIPKPQIVAPVAKGTPIIIGVPQVPRQ